MSSSILRVPAAKSWIVAGLLLKLGWCGSCSLARAQQRANPYEREYPSAIAPAEPWLGPNETHTPLTRTGDFASDMHQDMRRPDTPELSSDSRLPVFFPPWPPPLDHALGREPRAAGRFLPAAMLSQFVNAPFYAPLSTLLAFKSLNARLQARLEEYCATKLALENELRAKLTAVRELPPEARWRVLAAFAGEQTPKIARLEKTADELREECIARGVDWNDARTWRLGDTKDSRVPINAAFQVVRAAVFYQKGLSPAQRRLLREVAIELEFPVSAQVAAPPAASVFFSPDTARVQLPPDLPAELAANLAAYQSEKSTLRQELFDAFHRNDRTPFEFKRTGALRALAVEQAPRLAALERRAEDIRAGLAAVPEINRSATASHVPPELAIRLAAHFAKRRELGRLGPIAREQVRKRLGLDGMMPVTPMVAGEPAMRASKPAVSSSKAEQIREVMVSYNRDYTAEAKALARDWDEMRELVGRLCHAEMAGGGKTAEAVLSEFMRAWWAHEQAGLFRDYRTAVFEPGLSPEQRRLLFDAAIIRLELSLPGGGLQPN